MTCKASIIEQAYREGFAHGETYGNALAFFQDLAPTYRRECRWVTSDASTLAKEHVVVKRAHLGMMWEALSGGPRVAGLEAVLKELTDLFEQKTSRIDQLWHDPSWLDTIPGKPSYLGKWEAGAGCGEALWTIEDVETKETTIVFTDALAVEVVHPRATTCDFWTVKLCEYAMDIEAALATLEKPE